MVKLGFYIILVKLARILFIINIDYIIRVIFLVDITFYMRDLITLIKSVEYYRTNYILFIMLLCNYWWFCSTPAKQVLKHDPVFACQI